VSDSVFFRNRNKIVGKTHLHFVAESCVRPSGWKYIFNGSARMGVPFGLFQLFSQNRENLWKKSEVNTYIRMGNIATIMVIW
jgi:hypothetical protein